MTGARKTMVVATLLMAALSSYADLPRLNAVLNLGDTLNAIRIADPIQHTRMLQQLAALDGEAAAELQDDLDDGMQSFELMGHNSTLQAVVPEWFELPNLTTTESSRFTLDQLTGAQPVSAISAVLLTLDLPPPRFETLFQPPRLEMPFMGICNQTARAPPLALR